MAHDPKRWHHPGVAPEVLSVKFKPGKALKALHYLRLHNAKLGRRVGSLGSIRIHVDPKRSEQLARELVEADLVEHAEPDIIGQLCLIPNDPQYSNQYMLSIINCPQAWDATRGLPSVAVADLGTGIETTHSDLVGKFNTGHNVLDGSSNVTDTDGHGTATAGVLAAATNNGNDIASVGFNITVTPVKVSTGQNVNLSNVAEGIDWVRLNTSCKLINISIAAAANNPATWPTDLINAVNAAWAAGIALFAAAGNNNNSTKNIPAAMDNVVGVAGTNSTDDKYFSSNYGSWIDIAAPGQNIYVLGLGNSFTSSSGTSFSSPCVAAVAALMISVNPSLLNSDIVTALLDPANTDPTTGFPAPAPNRVNAAKAVAAAIGPNAIILLPNAYIDCFSQFVLQPNAYLDTSPLMLVGPNAYLDTFLAGSSSARAPIFQAVYGRSAYSRVAHAHTAGIPPDLMSVKPNAYVDVLANALTPNCYIDALSFMKVQPNCYIQSDPLFLKWIPFDNFRFQQYGPNAINLSTGAADVRCALINSDVPPNVEVDTFWPANYVEMTGGNYTVGGISLRAGQGVTLGGGVVKYTSSALVRWLNNPTGFVGARFAVLYDAQTNLLIAFGDLGTSYGTTILSLQILVDTNGILRNT